MPTSQEPATVDYGGAPETFCLGKFNLHQMGDLWVLTCTHVRPKAKELLDDAALNLESVVSARLVTSTENLIALRDVITKVTAAAAQATNAPNPTSSGGGRLN